ncbi:DUF397 domain-containing protein [Streptomyces sp. ID05-39B]|uniref:DUF397 domain-containing protein n=1 Tax=Streptomyces sp. ID05-39B TaxID=3028664 RepID=UPI0029AE94BC|nr:DUF397 domain-containing protein [Streptomyces sp. ID05-39B]MDX3532040.1 DUF397 domain-containing protein [Streptomyces sp. ID05-39B]
MIAAPSPEWFKSSYSGGSGTECVECARVDTGMLVRDSKQRDGAAFAVSGQAWRALIDTLHARVR